METSEKRNQKNVTPLIQAYGGLSAGAKAELRRLSDYRDVPILAAEAFWKTWNAAEIKYPQYVVSAMLILFRDRGAGGDLKESSRRLGAMFVGDGNDVPVKPGRFKRLLAVESLDAGFKTLRPVLRLFRHEKINWYEVAEFLAALHRHETEDSDRKNRNLFNKRKKLADAYFERAFSKE